MTTTKPKPVFRKVAPLLFMAIVVYFVGYLRSTVFVSINAQSSSVFYHDVNPELPGFMKFIADMNYHSLIRLKWMLTLLFSVVFCLLSLTCLYLSFGKRLYLKVCLIFYGVLTGVALIIMLIGIVLPSFSGHTYNIARNVIHIAQSPFTVLFLLMAAYYHQRTTQV